MKMLIVLFLCLVTSKTYSSELSCSQNGTRLYYINGITTTPTEAESTASLINDEIVIPNKDKIDKKGVVEVKTIYNSTRGMIEDIFEMYHEAMRTKSDNEQKVYYKEILSEKLAVISSKYPVGSAEYLKIEKDANEAYEYIYSDKNKEKISDTDEEKNVKKLEMQKVIAQLFADLRAMFEATAADANVTNAIKMNLRNSYDKHEKIITVSHSQGNEALRSSLVDFKRENASIENDFFRYFGVMHMASPSPGLVTSREHARAIKLDRDFVILGSTVYMPESPIAPTYKFERSELVSWVKYIPVVRMAVEFLVAFFDNSFYHSMSDIYLSDKVFASKLDGTDSSKSMRSIFTQNLIEVAESLEANCMSPVIRITAPDVTEVQGQLIATGYAGENRIIDLKVEDIGGDTNNDGVDDVPGYDRKQTEFSYKVEVVRPTSPPVVEELIEEPLSEDSNGSLQIKFNAPYRDYTYTITVTAVNYFGNKTEVSKALFIPNNEMPEATITDQVCYEGPYGSNEKGRMYYNLTTHDDSYLVDGRVRASVIEDRNYEDVISDGVNSKTVTVINQCQIKKIRYRWEVYAQCSVAYCINTSAGCDGITEPNDMFLRGTGYQTNYIRVYYPDGVPAPGAGLIGGGDNYWEAGSQGAFNDPNDFLNRITYPRASACPRDRVEDQNNEYIILQGN